MVIVFDLDDTLYEEKTFVFSGFHAVSTYLSSILSIPSSSIFEELKTEFFINRFFVFDRFLEKHKIKKKWLIKKCLSIYRGHKPNIALFEDAKECLIKLQKHTLYVVTDGNPLVQRKKFYALGLHPFIKFCFCTSSYGLSSAKPSPYCFQKICKMHKTSPSSVVYIGDNPYKDFIGIKPLGFQTIRLLQGPYKDIKISQEYEADLKIKHLGELLTFYG